MFKTDLWFAMKGLWGDDVSVSKRNIDDCPIYRIEIDTNEGFRSIVLSEPHFDMFIKACHDLRVDIKPTS